MRVKTRLCQAGMLLLAGLSIAMLSGCGSGTTPADSVISFNPTEINAAIAFDTCFKSTVVVRYPDGTPVPTAKLYIDGAFASPRLGAGRRYFFYEGWGCTDPAQYRDSGFNAETDDEGNYQYSLLVTAGSGTFDDNVQVYSGSSYNSQKITIQ